MTVEHRERTLTLMIIGGILIGVLFDVATGEVKEPGRVPVEGERIVEHASFCPPPLAVEKSAGQVTLGSVSTDEVPFSFAPEKKKKVLELPGPGATTLKADLATIPTAYGSTIGAFATLQVYEPVLGAGAARCSRSSSTRWYFAEGSSALGFDERLILYNPFPDEAVARVTFFTPTGDQSRARLAEGVAVPAGEVRSLKINEFVQPEPLLSTAVEMGRGRVIAWRASMVKPEEQPDGLQYSLGARSTSTTWYLPAGSVEPGVEERINILNPSSEEAVVSVSLLTAEETLQPPKLVEIPIRARSSRRLNLSEYMGRGQKNIGGAGAIVRSINDVGIVAERTIWYDLDAVAGVSSEIGSAVTNTRWLVPPALLKPSTDTLLLMNPGTERVRVDVSFLGDGPPSEPQKLQGLFVGPGSRRRIELPASTGMLMVTASGPVVAERSATSGRDAAAVMGLPAN